MIILVNDMGLFQLLSTDYNRTWITIIYLTNGDPEHQNWKLLISFSNDSWETKLFFYDFYYRIEQYKTYVTEL